MTCGAIALLLLVGTTAAEAAPAPLLQATKPDRIAGRYIVVLKDSAGTRSASRVTRIARRRGARIAHEYSRALTGFAAKLSETALSEVRADPAVAFVEPDARVTAQSTQPSATWGLDRIDQPALPLNATYNYSRTGAGVTAYIIDSGIRTGHTEFGGRASTGTDIIDGGPADDCNGHGTHVAGTVGGAKHGVAKQVKLVAVRVLDCSNEGTESGVAAGIDWVTANHVGTAPAVANISLGAEAIYPAMEQAIAKSIADGVTYTIAAGNYGIDACGFSPARVPSALTVGATDATDTRSYSNSGACVDVFAPGTEITSAWNTTNTATDTLSGTSMASPHVAGVAALYLQAVPSASPAIVSKAVVAGAIVGKIADAGTGSPNRLVQSQLTVVPPTPTTPPTPNTPTAKTVASAAAADAFLDFRFTGNLKQKPLRKSRGFALKLSCPQESCTVAVSGTVTVPTRSGAKKAKTYRLKRVKVTLDDTKPKTLKLKLSSSLRRHVARALGSPRTRNGVKAYLNATAGDDAVNRQTRKLTVRVLR